MPLSSKTLGMLAFVPNSSILVTNALFTRSDDFAAYNPAIFGAFGQLMIVVWGLAYVAAGHSNAGPAVWRVFALEKFCYVAAWVQFLVQQVSE